MKSYLRLDCSVNIRDADPEREDAKFASADSQVNIPNFGYLLAVCAHSHEAVAIALESSVFEASCARSRSTGQEPFRTIFSATEPNTNGLQPVIP